MDWSVAHKVLERFKKIATSVKEKSGDVKDSCVDPVVSTAASAKLKADRKKYRLKAWYASEGVKYLNASKPYLAYVFAYGLLLNYTLNILLSFPMTYYTVPAWGIAYYFLKEETSEYILTLRGKKR